jgi:hypothetical protein
MLEGILFGVLLCQLVLIVLRIQSSLEDDHEMP